MFHEEAYRHMNERIAPEQALVERVQAAARQKGARPAPRRRPVRRAVLIAALLLCLAAAAPALATVSPAVAQLFVPVQEACEDQGIRMELLSVYVHGDTAEAYVTLRDLIGDRIDGDTDLYDSYELSIPFDSKGTCSQAAFDAETGTATFLLQISTMDGRPIRGGKVSFSIGCFLSGMREALDVPLSVDWSRAADDPAVQPIDATGGSAGLDCDTALLPGELTEVHDGFYISAMGYIDGKLHIQLYIPGRYELDHHAALYLRDGAGGQIYGDSLYFGGYNAQTGERADHIDYVFDVAPERLPDCALYGSFWAASARVDGNWRVAFPLATGGQAE